MKENVKIEKHHLVCWLDSQSVKTAQSVSEEIGIDGGKKINGRKWTILVDKLGLPLAIKVIGANISDNQSGILSIDLLKGKSF